MIFEPVYEVAFTSYGRKTEAETEVIATNMAKPETRMLLDIMVDRWFLVALRLTVEQVFSFWGWFQRLALEILYAMVWQLTVSSLLEHSEPTVDDCVCTAAASLDEQNYYVPPFRRNFPQQLISCSSIIMTTDVIVPTNRSN